MATRTVKVATWQYRNAKGQRRRAYFGDEIELPKDEVERGDREGVFTPAPVPASTPTELERALASIQPRFSDPAGADESDVAPLHHDVQPVIEELAEDDDLPADDGVAPEPVPNTEPEQADSPAVELKRPAKAAAHEKWVEYVHKATGRPESELAELTKDELQAIKV